MPSEVLEGGNRICGKCGEQVPYLTWWWWDTFYCGKCDTANSRIISADYNTMMEIRLRYRETNFKNTIEEKQLKILKSGIRDVFTPAKPISAKELFFGRRNELDEIVAQLNIPGMHSLIYGDRGVGKSSLANIVSKSYIELKAKLGIDIQVYIESCDQFTTFVDIIEDALKESGIDTSISDIQTTTRNKASLGAKVILADASGEHEEERAVTSKGLKITPKFAAKSLKNIHGLLIIDEADALDNTEKLHIARFIKKLSDFDAKFKVLIVGISQTGEDLIKDHKSIKRCLPQTHLKRMQDDELTAIIEGGVYELAKKYNTKLQFDPNVVAKIVKLSLGYPYYTHLLALKCAELAIVFGYPVIQLIHLRRAREDAARSAMGNLKRISDDILLGEEKDIYKRVLFASSQIPNSNFTIKDLERYIYYNTGEHFSEELLNNYLDKITSIDDSNIFQHFGENRYRFSDPLMSSYIKIIADDEGMDYKNIIYYK